MTHARSGGLRLALSLLTVYPVRTPAEASGPMLYAPLVAIFLWLPAAVVTLLVRDLVGSLVSALLPATMAVSLIALLTRGLHLDGLADVGDALASYRSPAEARAVMRRGDVGPLGVVTVVLVLAIQVVCLDTAIYAHHGTVTLLVGLVTGRLLLTVNCVAGTPVAPDSRMGALVVGTVSRLGAIGSSVAVVAVCGVAASLDVHTADRGTEVLQAVSAPLVALLLLWPVRRHLVRRLGGINGDALGALCELGVMVALFVMAGQPT